MRICEHGNGTKYKVQKRARHNYQIQGCAHLLHRNRARNSAIMLLSLKANHWLKVILLT
jgi:hypothetical protein